jgi:hypothetical protein
VLEEIYSSLSILGKRRTDSHGRGSLDRQRPRWI